MIHLFAEASSIPTGAELTGFLSPLAYMAGLVLLGLKVVDHFREKPPIDKQVRDLEDRLNSKLDAEMEATSDWVQNNFVQKIELAGLEARLEEREKSATTFRTSFQLALTEIATITRGIDGKLNFIEGRASKTQKLTIETKGTS